MTPSHLELEITENVLLDGVENQVAVDMLRRRKCGQMQGYLVSEPMNGAAFESWLASRNLRRY